MATTKQNNSFRPRRWKRRVALWVALLAVAMLAWFWAPLRANARADVAYGARLACSCRYISGRELSDCRKDFKPGMGLVLLSEDSEENSVTARFPLLSSQTAIYRKGPGCVLERWAD